MQIRAEKKDDHAAVRAIHEAAFETDTESKLVAALRERACPLVSLIARVDETTVGHIMFSPVGLPNDIERKIMGLAPMAVSPEHQRRGVGSALVRAGLEECRRLGFGAVVVLGHPEYYPRFGFKPASRFGVGCRYEVPDEAFMAMELQPGCLDGIAGEVAYHEAFDSI